MDGLDLVRVDRDGQVERAAEGPDRPLAAVDARALLARVLALAAQRHRRTLERDLEVLGRDARHLDGEDEGVLGLVQVHGREGAAGRQARRERAEAIEQIVHLAAQGAEAGPGLLAPGPK